MEKYPHAVRFLQETGLTLNQALESTEKELKKREGTR
jgi:hypothetical protein